MPEVVEVETSTESQVSETTPEGVAAEPATPEIDEATWKRRIAGKDQALTAAQRERDAIKAERDSLAAWKAQTEQANMTELQKLQAERDQLAADAAAARAEALATRLGAQYPLAAELLGGDLSKFDEVRVAEINGRLAKEAAAEAEPVEPKVDANSPRRPAPRAPQVSDVESAKAALTAAGNPYFDDTAWGSTRRS